MLRRNETLAGPSSDRICRRSVVPLRTALLLASVSFVATVMAAGAPAADAQTLVIVNRGANGVDFHSTYDTTAGQAAAGVSVDLSRSYPRGNAGTVVELGSVGGWGGSGVSLAGIYKPGAVGGAAGGIGFWQFPETIVSGGSNEKALTPIISLYSLGGAGGVGPYNFGAGGASGIVSAQIYGRVAAEGANTGGIFLLSEGGSSGKFQGTSDVPSDLGSDDASGQRDAGASGNRVFLIIGSKAMITTDGAGAPAIIAASKGGFGGNPTTSVGGSYGSNGGNGGPVDVSNAGSIQTLGDQSPAIVLQSVGRKGGKGSDGVWVTTPTAGAAGGAGGAITAENTGTVSTLGNYSLGLVAQSVGGSGGRGGDGSSGASGGSSGKAGDVKIDNAGTITTLGKGASAIVAQSVGGGNALSAARLTVPTVGENAQDQDSSGAAGGRGLGLFWSSGGVGGVGGAAGTVSVKLTQNGTIRTSGDEAYGVLLQSVGGSGGRGGNAESKNVFLSIALGGSGGGGGDAGNVTFESDGRSGSQVQGGIETSGNHAAGVLGQSIGGGGGEGGDASASSLGVVLSTAVAVGGSGGSGGKGGIVDLKNRSAITTWGDDSAGLKGVSVGGGGGTAGDASAYALTLPAPKGVPSIAVGIAIGGSGGGGGDGDKAAVNNIANVVTTYGVGSAGLVAQSVGGGGGDSGNVLAQTLAISVASEAMTFAASIGGSGGSGGNGGHAEIRNSGRVVTYGNGSSGIFAQSIGGGGGDAGDATTNTNALSLSNSVHINVAVGGSGGSGGKGGDVLVQHAVESGNARDNQGPSVTTWGDRSSAIVAQSIGGGGGNAGGINAAAATNIGLGEGLNTLAQKFVLGHTVGITVALGGTGGSGGSGGNATVMTGVGSTLFTGGAQSSGIFAQSIGGGGGTGGGGTEKATTKMNAKVTIGGTGGSGGAGGAVKVTQRGAIKTQGDASHGIFAQSVGGGGGSGGNFTAAPSAVPNTFAQISKAIVKVFSTAGSLEKVLKYISPSTDAQMKATLEKIGTSEFAKIIKESDLYKNISAMNKYISDRNGVKLPSAEVTVSLGGTGGSGNVGGRVNVDNFGAISTDGNGAHGIFAQSIGGGGGNGGAAYGSGTRTFNLLVTLGGWGGVGARGGTSTVTNGGAITTAGDASYGVLAQSIGGGGGMGVGALSSQNKSVTLNFTVGRSGGTGDAGGAVTVINSGSISTSGAESHALLAQSVGGGGGAFVMNLATNKDAKEKPADAASVDVVKEFLKVFGLEEVPDAAPEDAAATKASFASASFTIGGSGGTGGDGGTVDITQSGSITTSGMGAFGVFAQSIGGGGGFSNAAGSPGGVKFVASMGGRGGAAADGGSVAVDLTGAGGNPSRITTSGNAATAVFAQSVGGGGGYGGAGVLMGDTMQYYGGSGGSSGNGGSISIRSGGAGTSISTTGTFAHGLWAQSLGGGGGATRNVLNVEAPVDVMKLAGDAAEYLSQYMDKTKKIDEILDAAPSDYRSIISLYRGVSIKEVQDKLSKEDTIKRRKASSGLGGAININIANGNISATGKDSFGILAQSGFQRVDGRLDTLDAETRAKNGNITVTYTGTIVGGSGNGAAIGIDGGNRNTITIGAGSTVSALSGKAILASFGSDTVINHGTIIGDVDLDVGDRGSALNVFKNEADGLYRSAGSGTINLGSYSGNFINRGTFDVGGVGQIAKATLVGSADLGGTLLADVTSVAPANAPSSDVLQVEYLTVSGVAIRPYAVNGLLPGNFPVVAARYNPTISAPATAGASPFSPISWSVAQVGNGLSQTGKSLVISPSAAFLAKAQSLTSRALTKTERAMLESAQSAWDSSNAGMAGFFAQAANLTTKQQFKALVKSGSASESNNMPTVTQSLASLDSLNASLSCPAFEGEGLRIHEGECVWSRVVGSRMARFGGSDGEGFNQTGMSYRVGAQWEVAPDWYLGATAAYDMSWLQASDGLSSTNGTGGDVSVALKHQMGPLLLAASLQAGYGTYETNNTLVVGTQQGSASNDTDAWTAGLKLRAAYEFAFQTWYLRPYVDVNVLHLSMPGYTFSANGMSVESGSVDHWSGVLQPVLEVGSRVNVGDDGWVRPYVGVGGTFVAGNSITTTSTFSYGGTQGISYETSNEMPSALLDVGGGVQFMNRAGYEVRGQYRAQLANDFVGQELSLRVSMKF